MFYAMVAVIALILDQMVKYWTTVNIPENVAGEAITHDLIPGLVHLTNLHNTGAAFSFLEGKRWFFVILCAIFVAVVIYVLLRDLVTHPGARWSAVFVMAGALGNAVDRIINTTPDANGAVGYVVDMFELEFMRFPVFNVADIYITLGAVLFCVFLILEERGKKNAPQEKPVNVRVVKAEPTGAETVRSAVSTPKTRPEPEEEPTEEDLFTRWEEQAKAQPAPAPQPEPEPELPVRSRAQELAQRIDTEGQPSKTERVMATLVRGRPVEEEPAPTPAPAPRPEPEPEVSFVTVEEPEPQPQPAPAPGEESYDLDDILAEFRDL